MPPAPCEPEKYSIDEMMERLKGQPSDDPTTAGELVTRADGTQALRVRKRKRRTEQPKRDESKRFKRVRMIQVACGLVLVLLAGLAIAGAYVYANTAPYRKAITDAIANSTGASVEFKQFRVSPASANAEAIEFEWPEGGVVKALRLTGVSARISPLSLFGTRLYGEEVSARDGSVLLQVPAADAPAAATPQHAATIPVQFNRIAVPRFNILIGDPLQPVFKILATEAALRMDETNHQLRLYHGSLQISGWPSFKIDRAAMEFHDAETDLILLRITDSQPKHGTLDLAGSIQSMATPAPSTLSVKLDNFDLGELLGADFGEMINAKIDTRPETGTNSLTFVSGALASAELKVAFKSTLSTKVNLKGFPFLQALVRALNDKWYENPIFADNAVGVIHRSNAGIEIREFSVEKKPRMAIKANLAVATDKSLSGTMEVGIPESVAKLAPNSKIRAMLSPAREGYRWLNLTLGGTLAHPDDNFTALYVAAKDTEEEAAEEPAADSDKAAAPDADPQKGFEHLTRPKDH